MCVTLRPLRHFSKYKPPLPVLRLVGLDPRKLPVLPVLTLEGLKPISCMSLVSQWQWSDFTGSNIAYLTEHMYIHKRELTCALSTLTIIDCRVKPVWQECAI